MKRLLVLTAILEAPTGLALLAVPAVVVRSFSVLKSPVRASLWAA